MSTEYGGLGLITFYYSPPPHAVLFSIPAMIERAIPSSSEKIPAIGIGTWRTFDPPSTSERVLAPIRETFSAFVSAGGRVIDSSPMYGKSEMVVGRLSHELGVNANLFIASKVWTSGRAAGVWQMTESMKLLGRTQVDLMQIHNLVDWRTQLPTLREWKAEGRIRYIGITHYDPSAYAALEAVLRSEQVDFVQLAYSATVRDAADRLLPLAADRGVAVLVNRPFEGGGLLSRNVKRALPPFAHAFAATWSEALLKFVLAHPAVTCAIPATASVEHLRDNLAAGDGRLPTDQECRELVSYLSS